MEEVRGGVSGRALGVKAEWGESGSLRGGVLGRGDGGSSRAEDEGESTGWGAGSVGSDAASNTLCESFYDWDGSDSQR